MVHRSYITDLLATYSIALMMFRKCLYSVYFLYVSYTRLFPFFFPFNFSLFKFSYLFVCLCQCLLRFPYAAFKCRDKIRLSKHNLKPVKLPWLTRPCIYLTHPEHFDWSPLHRSAFDMLGVGQNAAERSEVARRETYRGGTKATGMGRQLRRVDSFFLGLRIKTFL